MTSLPLRYWLNYLTEVDGVQWRNVDYKARGVVKGLKQESFNGYVQATINGKKRRFDQSNIEELIEFILPSVGRQLSQEISGPVSIVPIPNRGMALGQQGPFRTVELAKKVAAGLGANAQVCTALWWAQPREKGAHETNEYRHPDLYEPLLRIAGPKPDHPVVLFDDVLTSGSQMIAAARLLTKSGVSPILGVALARATKVQFNDGVWVRREGELDLSDLPIEFDEF